MARRFGGTFRPHPFFPTLEFRVCDIPTRVDDTVAIAALFQAIVAKLNTLNRKEPGFRLYRRATDPGKQVAGGALRSGRKDDRLW